MHLRPIAIHLPQYHPIAENDAWWGKGFTEWTNVAKAQPLFKGHYQPHLPADLGFYDMRLEESRLAQEALAKEYGIYGFCYYHYWFNGKRLLHEPVDRKLKNPKEDLPFMLCWANENWTRRWDGHDSEILIKQEYSEADDLEHIQFLCTHFFNDDRYIKVDGKPFISIYRPSLFPDINKTIKIWREEARKMGVGELYICFVKSFGADYDLTKFNIDAKIEFAPHFDTPPREYGSFYNKTLHKLLYYKKRIFQRLKLDFMVEKSLIVDHFVLKNSKNAFNLNRIFDYEKLLTREINKRVEFKTYPSLFPMWDKDRKSVV